MEGAVCKTWSEDEPPEEVMDEWKELFCKARSEDEPPEEVMEEWKELFAKQGLKMSLLKK